SILRRFLRFCADKKYISKDIVESWKPKVKYISRPVIYLTWDELMRVYTIELDEKLAAVRDVFCFMCFTGLRYSDAITLSKASVGDNTIQLTTKKTSRILRIALNNYAKEILDKYQSVRGNIVFPRIANAVMNVHLKTIAKKAGLDSIITLSQYYGSKRVDEEYFKHELISTHCGRRTFVVNALALGISPHVVMKWTGHSDLSAMKPYIDIADETLMQEMSKFNR
ncbi:MAG: site-specific integrase, partial [Muribaculaceae bacterium]|nr:site-specific integrase [Muribaculaceae bacterium]